MNTRFNRFTIAAFLLLFVANVAQAAIVLTNTSNITLQASQIESGGDMTPNPDVTGGAGGDLVAYSESGVPFDCCGPDYLGDNLVFSCKNKRLYFNA